MNPTGFTHYLTIGEQNVVFIVRGYLSGDKTEFEITSINSKWKGFDSEKVSEETKQQIIFDYLNIE